jgi:hypothetical protein
MKSEAGRTFFQNREERVARYKEAFAHSKIKNIPEPELAALIGNLWANEMWGDKSQPLRRILRHTTLEEFKNALETLLWGTPALAARYDKFRAEVKGMGPAMLTELMCLVSPDDFAIWNSGARQALNSLKMNDIVPTKIYDISGKEYETIITVFKELRDVLSSTNLPIALDNLLDVDYFLYFLSDRTKETSADIETKVSYEKIHYSFDHNEVRDAISDLGVGLGFESDTEVPIAKGAKIDVLWSSKIGNLGVIKYVFEVQSHGSIDSLIMNLLKAKSDPAVQRLVAVSDGDTLKKIEAEVSALNSEFKNSVSYLEATDALNASRMMQETKQILDKLQLVRST